LAIALVHLIGISKCLDSAGGRPNQRFLLEFSCLYPAVSLTSIAAVGGAHWLIRLGFEEAIQRLSVSNMGLAINLSSIGTDLFGLLLFVANVGLQALIYWRLQRLLLEVQQRKR
jgi:hypothetical protein